jgi:hypothetical protein
VEERMMTMRLINSPDGLIITAHQHPLRLLQKETLEVDIHFHGHRHCLHLIEGMVASEPYNIKYHHWE